MPEQAVPEGALTLKNTSPRKGTPGRQAGAHGGGWDQLLDSGPRGEERRWAHLRLPCTQVDLSDRTLCGGQQALSPALSCFIFLNKSFLQLTCKALVFQSRMREKPSWLGHGMAFRDKAVYPHSASGPRPGLPTELEEPTDEGSEGGRLSSHGVSEHQP